MERGEEGGKGRGGRSEIIQESLKRHVGGGGEFQKMEHGGKEEGRDEGQGHTNYRKTEKQRV